MELELRYSGRCADGTILYTKDPVEVVRVIRDQRPHGNDKVTKVSELSNQVQVGAGGRFKLELTKINAMFAKNAMADGLVDEDEDQLVACEAILKKREKAKADEKAPEGEGEGEGSAGKGKSPARPNVVSV